MLVRIREAGLSLLAVRSDAFLRLRAGEAEHFERERGVERRAGHPQPVVERVLGPAQRRLRAGSELARHLERLRLQLGFLAGERNEPQPLRLLAADLLAQQQVVLRLRHRSEEHTSELQSPFLISYAVFCLTRKKRFTTFFTETSVVMNLLLSYLLLR